MSIDHIGLYFFPEVLTFRILGRIAMPIYAYGIAKGFVYTKNKKRYGKRLLTLAIFSQVPYFYLHDYNMSLNIIFTFVLALILLSTLSKHSSWFTKSYIMILILFLTELFGFEYGSHAVLLVLIYRYAAKWALVPLHAILIGVYVYGGLMSVISWYSLIATIVITFYTYLPMIKINRTFYRIFYPMHLAIISLVLIIFNYIK